MCQPRKTIIETPFGAATPQGVEDNLTYLRQCMHDAIVFRDEAPFASHGLYTQPGVLDDRDPAERHKGIQAGFCWRMSAAVTVVYVDRGISGEMQLGLQDCALRGHRVEYRAFLGGERSWDLRIETLGTQVRVDAVGLPGGLVQLESLEAAISRLTEIAVGSPRGEQRNSGESEPRKPGVWSGKVSGEWLEGVAGDSCDSGNECGRTGCGGCQQ